MGVPQKPGQEGTGCDVVRQAERRPPCRHPGIGHHVSVKEIKESMSDECSDNQPKILLEADYRNQQKTGEHEGLRFDGITGSSDHGKQDVVGGNNNEQRGIERTIPVEADQGRDDGDRKREGDSC